MSFVGILMLEAHIRNKTMPLSIGIIFLPTVDKHFLAAEMLSVPDFKPTEGCS